MSAGQQIGTLVAMAIGFVSLFGPFVSQRDVHTPSNAADVVLSSAAQSSPVEKSAEEQMTAILEGSKPNLALALFDEWLTALERQVIILSATGLDSGFKQMERLSRENGVAEKDIKKRRRRFERLKYSRKA